MKPGDRIGAYMSRDTTTVNFLGFGVYEGDEIPPEDAGGFAKLVREIGMTNPKLKLDNGVVVWGCECWWGPEEKVKADMEEAKQNGLIVRHVTKTGDSIQ
jgi:hypothetical protein